MIDIKTTNAKSVKLYKYHPNFFVLFLISYFETTKDLHDLVTYKYYVSNVEFLIGISMIGNYFT